MNKLYTFLDNEALNYQMFGSKVISPHEPSNDIDYIVLVKNFHDFDKEIQNALGFQRSTDYLGQDFTSYRKGDINLVVTTNDKFYDCTILATRFATMLGCKTKQERIYAFETVMVPNGFQYKNGKKNA